MFEKSPELFLVLLPDLTIVATSDEYLRVTLNRVDDITGKYLFDVFPDNPVDDDAQAVSNISASIKFVLMSNTLRNLILK